MNYGSIITNAWSITWRHRYLWLLGLFVGGGYSGCGASSNYRFGPGGIPSMGPYGPRAGDFAAWAAAHSGLLVALAILAVLIFLALIVVSFVAQGGLTVATADLARGRPMTAGRAWRSGLRLFWRYLGLAVLVFLVAVAVAIAVAILVAIFVGLASALGGVAQIFVIIVGAFIGVAVFLALVIFAIAFGVVVSYAQRAMVVNQVGPLGALTVGSQVLQDHLGPSFVLWLISVGLGIVAAVAVLIIATIVAIPLVLIGLALSAAVGGFGVAMAVYAVVAGLIWLVIVLAAGAVSNTYFWTYWTLGYLELTGGPSAAWTARGG